MPINVNLNFYKTWISLNSDRNNVLLLDSGSDASNDLTWASTITGSVSSSTTSAITGPRSYQCDSTGSNAAAYLTYLYKLNKSCGRISFEILLDQLPSTSTTLAALFNVAATTAVFGIKYNSTSGFLELWRNSALLKSGTSTISAGGAGRLSIVYKIIRDTYWECKVYINGFLEISATNVDGTLEAIDCAHLIIGWVSAPGASKIVRLDSIYTDSHYNMLDVGSLKITYKAPGSASANFDTAVGSGSVSERPFSNTNGRQHAAATTATQSYPLETSSSGDMNISTKTIVAIESFIYAKQGASGNGDDEAIIVNGNHYPIALTSSDALYRIIAKANSYPSVSNSVGLKASGGTIDTFLYECGMLIAYTDTLNNKSLSGTITSNSSLIKQSNIIRSGLSNLSGLLNKQINQILEGDVSPSSSIIKLGQKIYNGSLTPSGEETRLTYKNNLGSITPSGISVKQLVKNFVGSIAPTGLSVKETRKLISGSITPDGLLTKNFVRVISLAGTLALSGEIRKISQKYPSSTLATSGAVRKTITKILLSNLASGGSLRKIIYKILSGSFINDETINAAFYYGWFKTGDESTNGHWAPHNSNAYVNPPSIGEYDSDSLDTLSVQCSMALYAHIQAFICSWWGIADSYRTDANFKIFLDYIAYDTNCPYPQLKLILYMELEQGESGPSEATILSYMEYWRTNYFYHPAYKRRGGSTPIVFVYDPQNDQAASDRWYNARETYKTNHPGEDIEIVMHTYGGWESDDHVDDFIFHTYACADANPSNSVYHNTAAATLSHPYATTVCPGFENLPTPGELLVRDYDEFVTALLDQNVYVAVFKFLGTPQKFRLITTFNEKGEGSEIEACTNFGPSLDDEEIEDFEYLYAVRSVWPDLASTSLYGTIYKLAVKPLASSISTSGSLIKSIAKRISGTVASSATATKQISKVITGIVSSSGNKISLIYKNLSGNITPSSVLTKLIYKIFSGSITPSGDLQAVFDTGVIYVSLSGSISPSGNLEKLTFKINLGNIIPSGEKASQIIKSFSGIISSSSSVVKTTQKVVSGIINPSSTLNRLIYKILSGSVDSSGNLNAIFDVGVFYVSLSGSISPSGEINKISFKTSFGNIIPSANIVKSVSKKLSSSLTSVGSLNASIYIGRIVARIKDIAKNGLSITNTLKSNTNMNEKSNNSVLGNELKNNSNMSEKSNNAEIKDE